MKKSSFVTFSKNERFLIILLLLIAIVLGALVINDFGQSTDEYGDYLYAKDVLRAYAGSDDFLNHFNREFYGPAHLSFSYLSGRLGIALPLGWLEVDGRHFANYFSFLVGVIALYFLLRIYFKPNVAGVTTFIFASQPLLFGSAFINQKDIPFMAMTLASLAAGFYAIHNKVCVKGDGSAFSQHPRMMEAIKQDWNAQNRRGVIIFILITMGLLFLMIDLIFEVFLYPTAEELLRKAYQGQGPVIVNSLFESIATDAYKTPVALYMDKLQLIYSWTSAAGLLLVMVMFGLLLRLMTPRTYAILLQKMPVHPLAAIASGAILGFSTSIRVAAPLIGVVVSVYGFYQLGRKVVGGLVMYWLAWGLFTFLTWPFLWFDPINNFWDSLALMSSFPSHQVLYMGKVLSSHNLPWHYLPVLLLIQLTLPALILIALGMGIGLFNQENRERLTSFTLISMVFIVPTLMVVIFSRPVYGNLRQLYFILPPLFIWMGFSIESMLARLPSTLPRALVVMLLVVPSFFHNVRLHPYQYTYYNALVGFSRGASGEFALDYWCTSYREAMNYLNSIAPENYEVGVWGPLMSAREFAREDLDVKLIEDFEVAPDYILGCKLALYDDQFFPELPTIFEVERAGAVYGIIKSRTN